MNGVPKATASAALARIEQEGPPRDLFDRPATRFVADFMGVENIFDGVLTEIRDGRASVKIGDSVIDGEYRGTDPIEPGTRVFAAVRAEKVQFTEGPGQSDKDANRFACKPASTIYKGKYYDLGVKTEIGPVIGRVWEFGDETVTPTHVAWRVADCIVAPDER